MNRIESLSQADKVIIGVISDTHGTLTASARDALAGVQAILHAGDIGTPEVIEDLERIAPVIAVRANMDAGPWCRSLPDTEAVKLGGIGIYLLHDLNELDLDPAAGGFRMVVSGHTHRPAAREHQGSLYLNPGSAAYPRHGHPAGIARARIEGARLTHRLISLT